MRLHRSLAAAAFFTLCAVALAQQAQIHLSAFPTMSVADGRSTTTIRATIRDSRGNLVADGTRVIFESTLGDFRESIVTTQNGVARAVLQAGGVPGVATIKVRTVDAVSQPSTMEFEFKADRALLSSATEYIELVSPNYMEFVPDTKIVAAEAPNKGVFVKYRDITVTADDLQINIPRYELRAKKARLKIGKLEKDFDELYLRLNERTGIGTTFFTMVPPSPIVMRGWTPRFLTQDRAKFEQIGKEVERFGLVYLKGDTFTPAATVDEAFRMGFEDIGVYTSSIGAKKAIIFPHKEIQFQQAEILVTGSRVMKMPLYQVSLVQSGPPSVMSSLVNVQNNQLQVNYPYYLTLKPGSTSLLRFRTGEQYGRGINTSSGAFLDYEVQWNRGDDMDGRFTISGIGRRDWSLGVQQYTRVDDRTSVFGMIELPANQSLYGSANVNRMYDGFQVNLNASMNHYIRGIRYSTRDFSFIAEKDPTKVGSLPVKLFYGITAQQNYNSLTNTGQSAVGVRARLQSSPLKLDSKSTIHTGVAVSHLTGQNTLNGLGVAGEASLYHQFNGALSFRGTYNYVRDGFNEMFLGRQRVGLEARYNSERFLFNLLAMKSLDVSRSSLFGDLSIGLSHRWWLTGTYTLDRYLDYQFLDYTFGIGYRLYGREIGLVWARSTNRIGLQLLGASF